MKVFIVKHTRFGLRAEDTTVDVVAVFSSKEKATAFAKEKAKKIVELGDRLSSLGEGTYSFKWNEDKTSLSVRGQCYEIDENTDFNIVEYEVL